MRQHEYDVVHVRDYGLQAAPDQTILLRAAQEDRILVSADTDFGTLLAAQRLRRSSLILLRRLLGRRPDEQAVLVSRVLNLFEEDLENGCIVVVEEGRTRVRLLPLS
jgi:predicted nuclease of predicted toxin-antitoxin system